MVSLGVKGVRAKNIDLERRRQPPFLPTAPSRTFYAPFPVFSKAGLCMLEMLTLSVLSSTMANQKLKKTRPFKSDSESLSVLQGFDSGSDFQRNAAYCHLYSLSRIVLLLLFKFYPYLIKRINEHPLTPSFDEVLGCGTSVMCAFSFCNAHEFTASAFLEKIIQFRENLLDFRLVFSLIDRLTLWRSAFAISFRGRVARNPATLRIEPFQRRNFLM